MEQHPNDPRFQPQFNASAQQPFRADVAPGYAAYAQGPVQSRDAAAAMYGDAAGEYIHMQRGRYGAMMYVVFGFILQIGWLFLLTAMVLGLLAALLPIEDDAKYAIASVPAGVLAIVGAWWTFRDRWRCIEAFSSRFCSGIANFSVLYVPAIAWGYANYRLIQKFRGR